MGWTVVGSRGWETMRDGPQAPILAAGCDEVAELLARRGLPVAARVASLDYLLPLAALGRPGAVLLGARPGEEGSLVTAVSRLRLAVPGCPVVVLSGVEDAAALEQAGAAAVFRPPYDAEAVTRALEDLLQPSGPVRGAEPWAWGGGPDAAGEAWLREQAWGRQAAPPACWDQSVGGAPGVVAVLVSNKGGVGRSVLAALLAACLGRRMPGQVLLLDLDLSCGDLETYVNAPPGADLTELAASGERLDLGLLARCVRRLPPGVDFLPGPRRPETAAGVTVPHLEDLLGWGRRRYRVVVADTGGDVADERLAPLLAAATHLLVPTLPDPASLRQARLTLTVLGSRGAAQAARVLPVLNRAGRSLVRAAGIMEVLGVRPVLAVPEDRLLAHRGGAAMGLAGWAALLSPGGRAVARLAELVLGTGEKGTGRGGRWWRGPFRGGADGGEGEARWAGF